MSNSARIAIIDYNMGNLFNLHKVITYLGGDVEFCSDPEKLKKADKAFLPGVGAFENGITSLKKNGMDKAIRDFIESGKPLFGICLGMQLLMDESEEGGIFQGLGIVPGRVVRFSSAENYFKIPHIGWNSLNLPSNKLSWLNTIFADIHPQDYVYFVHSFIVCPVDNNIILTKTQYGLQDFCSSFMKDNIYGCQFHPEISGPIGLRILRNFLNK